MSGCPTPPPTHPPTRPPTTTPSHRRHRHRTSTPTTTTHRTPTVRAARRGRSPTPPTPPANLLSAARARAGGGTGGRGPGGDRRGVHVQWKSALLAALFHQASSVVRTDPPVHLRAWGGVGRDGGRADLVARDQLRADGHALGPPRQRRLHTHTHTHTRTPARARSHEHATAGRPLLPPPPTRPPPAHPPPFPLRIRAARPPGPEAARTRGGGERRAPVLVGAGVGGCGWVGVGWRVGAGGRLPAAAPSGSRPPAAPPAPAPTPPATPPPPPRTSKTRRRRARPF